jgi:predicted O-methyltransferase YrrM
MPGDTAPLTEAEKILKEIEARTKKKFLPIVGPHRGKILIEIIRENKPKNILEVGTLIGYSTILMAKELESDSHITAIEIHKEEAETARKNIKKANVRPTIDVITGDAKQIIPKLSGRLDLVFLDADKNENMQYLRLFESKLHKGSIIIADNVRMAEDQMKNYLNYVRTSGKYKSKYVPIDEDALEISIKL